MRGLNDKYSQTITLILPVTTFYLHLNRNVELNQCFLFVGPWEGKTRTGDPVYFIHVKRRDRPRHLAGYIEKDVIV
jgi:hypothetical protein